MKGCAICVLIFLENENEELINLLYEHIIL